MKKILIACTLSIILQSSITVCQERKSNPAHIALGLTALIGIGYGIYHYKNTDITPTPTGKENQSSLGAVIDVTKNTIPQMNSLNNKPQDENKQEKKDLKKEIENKPSKNNSALAQTTANKQEVATEKQMSISEAFYYRLKEDDIKKLLTDTLLTDHAFFY